MKNESENSCQSFYAQTYDESVPDWPGEIDFYQELATPVKAKGASMLEVACGTGRVAIRLAQQGVNVVGLDLSSEMLGVARQKSKDLVNIRWIQADMRSFDLGEQFELAIIPGHSFQHLNTPMDQVDCLTCIQNHLVSDGLLVLHLDYPDFAWLGDLVRENGGVFADQESFRHPKTGNLVQAKRAWWFETSNQTATCQTRWEEVDSNGMVIRTIKKDPARLHAIFPFEVEHLLARVGLSVEAVYGDFFRNPLNDMSPGMIWVARKV